MVAIFLTIYIYIYFLNIFLKFDFIEQISKVKAFTAKGNPAI